MHNIRWKLKILTQHLISDDIVNLVIDYEKFGVFDWLTLCRRNYLIAEHIGHFRLSSLDKFRELCYDEVFPPDYRIITNVYIQNEELFFTMASLATYSIPSIVLKKQFDKFVQFLKEFMPSFAAISHLL
jgi:hypothetical protein